MNRKLKNAIESLYDLCAPIEGIGSQKFLSGSRERLKTECVDYLSYLSASDGTIAPVEAEFIREYLGEFFSAEELNRYIIENNTYSSEFEVKTPETLKELVERDNYFFCNNGVLECSLSSAYVLVFEALGKEFLVCDGEASDNEIADYTLYTGNLNDYIKNHAKFPETTLSAIDVSDIHAGENIPQFDENGERIETLDDLLEELNGLIGLQNVKKDVNSLIHLQEIKRIRAQRGMKEIPISNHLVFYGNPGTGKTTVARLIARIYHAMGILSKGQFVEVDRSGLVAGYIGQTAIKVQDVVKSALGGILFIDEAYSLTYSSSENDYGQEAIDTLLKAMEDNREDFIVIVAGYPQLMAKFIDSNPGLRSRFNKYINFEDYSVPELVDIFKVMCEKAGYYPTKESIEYAEKEFERKYKNRGKNFANAREVRNFFEKAVIKQADRLFEIANPTDEQLSTLEIVDLE